jgi:cytochrome c oxidase assembly protein subunit 11
MMAKLKQRNRGTAIVLAGVVAGMVGVAYAAVPLYQLFCQVTGYGGTTQTAVAAPGPAGDRVMTVQFNADTARGMPWKFRPMQRELKVRIGEETLAFYEVRNDAGGRVVGTATFNVTPHKAGPYFDKIDCFCFERQVLAAGERAEMPVSFFIDPAILDDPNLNDVNTITLSYTMFEAEPDEEDGEGQLPQTQQTSSLAERKDAVN